MPHRLTVRQNLEVFARLYAVADVAARIAALARDLALEEFIDRRSGELSAGQKTRVAKLKEEPLDYSLLRELTTVPRTTYMARIRNPNPRLEGDAEGGTA